MTIMNCGGNAQGSGLPDPTSATAGDVLTLDSNKDVVWQTPSGGGFIANTLYTNTTVSNIITDLFELTLDNTSLVNTITAKRNIRIMALNYPSNSEMEISELLIPKGTVYTVYRTSANQQIKLYLFMSPSPTKAMFNLAFDYTTTGNPQSFKVWKDSTSLTQITVENSRTNGFKIYTD